MKRDFMDDYMNYEFPEEDSWQDTLMGLFILSALSLMPIYLIWFCVDKVISAVGG